MNKAALLDRLQAERARLEATLAELDDARMTQPGVLDTWSVKDIVAHITVWDQRGTQWTADGGRGEKPQVPLPGLSWADMDRLNAQTFIENQYRPLQEVLAEFRLTYQHLLDTVQALSQDDLERTFEFEWYGGGPLALWKIIAWRYDHYDEHRAQIRAWMDRP